ncbi:MAG: Na(+)/H(+) antiporter subunit B [Candidatus Competibacterales bacterium]
MTAGLLILDFVLATLIVALGYFVALAPRSAVATVAFMALGLVMALAWGRLGAVDVALAEAALGAGIIGALLLNAQGVLGREADAQSPPLPKLVRWGLGGLIVVWSGVLAWALVIHGAVPKADLATLVYDTIDQSGVSHPVTAVLLNFRAYDTLLEVLVLLIALLGVAALAPAVAPPPPNALLDGTLRLVSPLAILVALYVLWSGSHSPGGAFQAGAVLAGLGVLWWFGGWLTPSPTTPSVPPGADRWLTAVGLGIFALVAAVGPLLFQVAPLTYPDGFAKGLILLIESFLMVSIAWTLLLLFCQRFGLVR